MNATLSAQADTPLWAVTLRNALIKRHNDVDRERIGEEIEFWQDSIRANYRYPENPERKLAAERIHEWYWSEVRGRSYQARNWRITPERSVLFQKFRSDPYYLLKNLVEIVARWLVEETLRSMGKNVRVYISSDSDDVFSWVDLIVEEKTAKGKDYTGLDLAVSDSREYLDQKELRTQTVCREFNSFMGFDGEKAMSRQVFAVPPRVMSKFIMEYMNMIGAGQKIDNATTLRLLEEAKVRNVSQVTNRYQSRVHSILH